MVFVARNDSGGIGYMRMDRDYFFVSSLAERKKIYL